MDGAVVDQGPRARKGQPQPQTSRWRIEAADPKITVACLMRTARLGCRGTLCRRRPTSLCAHSCGRGKGVGSIPESLDDSEEEI